MSVYCRRKMCVECWSVQKCFIVVLCIIACFCLFILIGTCTLLQFVFIATFLSMGKLELCSHAQIETRNKEIWLIMDYLFVYGLTDLQQKFDIKFPSPLCRYPNAKVIIWQKSSIALVWVTPCWLQASDQFIWSIIQDSPSHSQP